MSGRRNMPETGFVVPIVTDRAVLRFVERFHGIDVETMRQMIQSRCVDGVRYGASAVISDGAKFILRGDTVVSCYPKHWPSRDYREGGADG